MVQRVAFIDQQQDIPFKKRLADKLKSVLTVGTEVKLVEPNTIARSDGKSKRVIDKRNID